ncbi:MAG: heme exporter protein CcmB [Nitrospinota bacterium]
MRFLKDTWAIVQKDIVSELRTREIFSSMFIFALLVIIIFIFTIDLSEVRGMDIAPGVLWVAFTFSGTIGLNRSFLFEKENNCLEGLMLSPMDRSAIYFGKMIGNLIFMSVMEAFTLPIFIIFFNVSVSGRIPQLLLIIFLSTLGFVLLGTLLSSMSASVKTRDIMLPILLYPLIVPVIIAAVKSTGAIFEGKSLEGVMHWLKLIIVFDIIFLAVSFMTFDYIIEE